MICQGQGYAKRADQYKIIGSYPDQVMGNKTIVVHQATHKKLIMKMVRNDEPALTKLQSQAELFALQMTYKCGKTIDLVDHFTDSEGNSYIITKKPKMTLTSFLDGLPSNQGVTVK